MSTSKKWSKPGLGDLIQLGVFSLITSIVLRLTFVLIAANNPITTPAQSWTDDHYVAALLLGMCFSLVVSVVSFAVFDKVQPLHQQLVSQNKSGKVSWYKLYSAKAATFLSVSLCIISLLFGIIFLGYKLVSNSSLVFMVRLVYVFVFLCFGLCFVWGWELLTSFLAGLFSSGDSRQKSKGKTPKKHSGVENNSTIREYNRQIFELREELQEVIKSQTRLEIKCQELNGLINKYDQLIQSETEEDNLEKLRQKKKDVETRLDVLNGKLCDILSIQVDIQKQINELETKLSLAISLVDLDKSILFRAGSEADRGNLFSENVERFASFKKSSQENFEQSEKLLNQPEASDKIDERVSNLKDSVKTLRKLFSSGCNFHKLLQDQTGQTKRNYKTLLESVEKLERSHGEAAALKERENLKSLVENAEQYQAMLSELKELLESLKERAVTMEHELTIAMADQDIYKFKKSKSQD